MALRECFARGVVGFARDELFYLLDYFANHFGCDFFDCFFGELFEDDGHGGVEYGEGSCVGFGVVGGGWIGIFGDVREGWGL